MSGPIGRVLLRFAPAIYGPTVLFGIGEGAILPLLPVIATQLGADVALATLVAAMLVLGRLCGNLPAGWAVARFGERQSMVVSGTVALAGATGVALAPNLVVLSLASLLIGLCAAVFGLARHAFMTTHVPFEFRARALALLGGTFRLGAFVGPLVAAGLMAWTGTAASAAWFFAVCLVLTVALVLIAPDPEGAVAGRVRGPRGSGSLPGAGLAGSGLAGSGLAGSGLAGSAAGGSSLAGSSGGAGDAAAGSAAAHSGKSAPGDGVFRTMILHRGVLARLGLSSASLSALRAAMQVILPVWGIAIGAEASTIALVVGLAGGCDFALFYVSGQITDKFGRQWATIPAMLLMSVGMLILAVSAFLPASSAFVWFVMLAGVMGAGNGLSAGLLLTLGADLAPRHDPAPFLGSWHTLCDLGSAVAPLLIAAVTSAVSLPIAAAAMGVVGLAGTAGYLRWIPRYEAKE